MGHIVIVDDKARVVIPKEVREELDIKKGSSLILEVKDNIIVLRVNRSSPEHIYGIAGEEKVKLEEIEDSLGYEGIH